MIPRARLRPPRPTVAVALTVAATLTLGLAPASTVGAAQYQPTSEDIADRLEAVPGLRVVDEKETEPGFRFFVLGYRQPADHGDPDSVTFEQRLTLLHRGTDRPTVLHTSGYGVSTQPSRAEPTRIVDGNQLSVEQRFFEPSRPDPADWSDLDIRQAAADHHRIVTALDGIYDEEWVSTGASKGGMTSVYHRRFYPDDLEGTVAYVAPNDVRDHEDHAYLEFFEEVGDSRRCQRDLEALQEEALRRRDALVDHYERLAAENGWTFHRTIGSSDRAFEMLVLDTAWAFWQYQPTSRCAEIPAPDASTADIAAFLNEVAGFDFYTDQGTTPYVPYYYQAATQLGSPSVPTDHLKGLLRYPGLFTARSYLPDDLAVPPFDRHAMPDIDRWVRQRGERLLFVDGEYDPWSAEHFRVGRGNGEEPGERSTMRFVAPGANHGADIEQLAPEDRATATTALRRWAGVADEAPQGPDDRVEVLDDAGDRRQETERRLP